MQVRGFQSFILFVSLAFGGFVTANAQTRNMPETSAQAAESQATDAEATKVQWPNFRGAKFSNSAELNLPSEINDQAIRWTVDLPGRGVSGPIVVDNRVFVTASSTEKQNELHVFCIDASSGNQLWHRQFWALGRCGSDPTSANAAPTPVADGQHVVALYSSNDLVCFDLEGNLKWLRALTEDYPNAANDIGMSSSPLIHQGNVIVQIESQGDAFVAAIDIATGQNVWKTPRPKKDSWSSPLLLPATADRPAQVITLSADRLSSLDAATGAVLWEIKGTTFPIPSPVYDNASNTLLASINGLSAFRINGNSEPELIWSEQRLSPSNVSLAIASGKLYSLNRSSVAVCAEIADGSEVWKTRIGGNHYSSPLITESYGYYFAQDGTARIVDLKAAEPEVVSERKFDQPILGSPAADSTGVYVRLQNQLLKIGVANEP